MTPASSNYTSFILAQINCAGLRSRLLTTEIDAAHTALANSLVDADGALEWLADVGAIGVVTLPSSIITSLST